MPITVDRSTSGKGETAVAGPRWSAADASFASGAPPLIGEIAAAGGPWLMPLTAEQYLAAVREGIFREKAQIELIDGLLFHKDRRDAEGDLMMEGDRHYLTKNLLWQVLDAFVTPLGFHAVTEPPVLLSDFTLPEPDVGVFRGRLLDYRGRLPRAQDAAVLIEVAWSSLRHDRSVKLARYAEAGVPSCWIVNLSSATVEVHTSPEPKASRYSEMRTFDSNAAIPLCSFDAGTLEIPVADFLPE